MAIVGDAAATDPACVKSAHHARMAALVAEAQAAAAAHDHAADFVYRRIGAVRETDARIKA
jgi:pyrroloquinoline quinone biosynthesis protein E